MTAAKKQDAKLLSPERLSHIEALEAKLAEAEHRLGEEIVLRHAQCTRAEAAEARVRELEVEVERLKYLLTECADRDDQDMVKKCITARNGDTEAAVECLAYIDETNRMSAAVCEEVTNALRTADRKAYCRLPRWAR